jgi:hypothetical protein
VEKMAMPNRQAFMRGGCLRALLTGWVWDVNQFAVDFASLTVATFQLANRPALGVALRVPTNHQFVRPQWGIV